MSSAKTELKHGVQFYVVQIAATPGLVLWLFNWLAVLYYAVYKLAATTNIVQTYNKPEPPVAEQVTAPSLVGLLIVGALALAVWYVIGFIVHLVLSKFADRFQNPLTVYRLLTIGGGVVGSLVVAIGVSVLGAQTSITLSVLAGGAVGLLSFALQQLLAHWWNVELV